MSETPEAPGPGSEGDGGEKKSSAKILLIPLFISPVVLFVVLLVVFGGARKNSGGGEAPKSVEVKAYERMLEGLKARVMTAQAKAQELGQQRIEKRLQAVYDALDAHFRKNPDCLLVDTNMMIEKARELRMHGEQTYGEYQDLKENFDPDAGTPEPDIRLVDEARFYLQSTNPIFAALGEIYAYKEKMGSIHRSAGGQWEWEALKEEINRLIEHLGKE